MLQFWEMYSVYKTKKAETPMEETAWGNWNLEMKDKAEKDPKDDDMVAIAEGDKDHAAYKVRKGASYYRLSYCHRPVDIKIIGVFDTVGSMGIPNNRLVDVTGYNKEYAFHNTNLHPDFDHAF
ncbi:hypothetical protein N7G274_007670 [Stereocaulon virgatum]|uniref:T6SS Phospholipase effector Tle1-like catalytic domain-containing protein n=1 Tax=Stereocaulon virgatum TaxID=373712 RepID=A0ABR4A7U0_9LECA